MPEEERERAMPDTERPEPRGLEYTYHSAPRGQSTIWFDCPSCNEHLQMLCWARRKKCPNCGRAFTYAYGNVVAMPHTERPPWAFTDEKRDLVIRQMDICAGQHVNCAHGLISLLEREVARTVAKWLRAEMRAEAEAGGDQMVAVDRFIEQAE